MSLLLLIRSGGVSPPAPTPVASTAFLLGGTFVASLAAPIAVPPVQVLVGPPDKGAYHNITQYVHIDSITIEESGTRDESSASFVFRDEDLLYNALRGEWRVLIQHQNETVFRGYIGRPSLSVKAIWGEHSVSCRDFSSMLDRLIVKSRFVRQAGESDKARIQWLFDTIGQPMVSEGMTAWGRVQVLNASMPKQTFPPRLTLRQCIERVLAAASDSANYYVDHWPRLHTFDADNPEDGWTADANVNVTAIPDADEFAPEEFQWDWDTDGLVNAYYVRGKNAAGSGWYPDRDIMDGPWSSSLFGMRAAYIDAPDADTQAKATRVARAALRDTWNPIPRGSYKVFIERDDPRLEAGQLQFVTSSIHGLNGPGSDQGPWAGKWPMQPLRIVSVRTSYLNGYGDRMQEVEIGGRRIHRYQASIG